MNTRHTPNENERQTNSNRFAFRGQLQTIMEVDDSRAPGERVKKSQSPKQDRGVKRPLHEMIGPAIHNDGNDTDSQRTMTTQRLCLTARSGGDNWTRTGGSRPVKRTVPSKRCVLSATPSAPHDSQKRCKEESSAVCQQDQRKRNMKSLQVAPSGGGVSKLIRNQLKAVADDKREMHKQLQIEHLQLQRSFALWRQLVEEARRRQDNDELATWAEEKEGILKSTKKLQEKVEELQEKLSEYREQNELLEFRILEFDHCQAKQSTTCSDSVSSPGPGFCTTGCTQPEDPCFRLFQDQVSHYQDLEFRADELLEELRLLSGQPGLSCSQRSSLARTSLCVSRCKSEAMSATGLLPPQQILCTDNQVQQTTQNQGQFLGSQWLEKILFGRKCLGSIGDKSMDEDEGELSDQSLLQETSMTESEMGQALGTEWPVALVESDHKTVEHQHSEDEGLGEDSRRSTEPNSLASEDCDTKTLLTLVDDLRKKNSYLRMELRQAEILVRTLKFQADRVQELEQELTRTEKEKSEYQEQILELEEAENDARLESQTLRTVVQKLRQHEDDLEKSLSATRDRLDECELRASSAGTTAEDLKLQVAYLEEMVCRYEGHIKRLEWAKSELHKKLYETKKDYTDVEIQVNMLRKDFSDVSVQVEDEGVQCKCFQTTELLSRLQTLEDKGGMFRNQLSQIDEIHLYLLEKLYCCKAVVCECKTQEEVDEPDKQENETAGALDGLMDAQIDSSNTNELRQEVQESEKEISERLLLLERNERKLRTQLLELERINQDFEKELEVRERLSQDKELELSQWMKRERELKVAIDELERERVSLRQQTEHLEEERAKLRDALEHLQEDYGRLKLLHCQETRDLYTRHGDIARNVQEAEGQDEEDHQKLLKLPDETLYSKPEEGTQVNEMSLVFETKIKDLRACHEIKEKHLHDEMLFLRCRDDQCCSKVQELVAQRERLEFHLAEREKQLQSLTVEYQKKSQAMDEERRLVENELQNKMKEMEENTASAVQELEERRKHLETSLRADMDDLRSKESSYKIRIRELERSVESLRNQITSLAKGVEGDDYPLEDSEYQHRIEELEKKEAAYVETLENADKIISQMELRYRDNIQRLEGSERSLQERVVQLETTEAQLRSALQNEKRSLDNGRVTDLVRELVEAEIRETSLKEHADELEASQKSLLQKARELEKVNQKITEELREHEDSSLAARDLRQEQERLKDEINQLRRSEAALKETLAHADSILAQREHVLAVRVSDLEAEKQDSDEMVRQLREHVRTLQEQLDQAQFHQAVPGPRETADTEVSREEISDLKLEVLELEKLILRSSWTCGEHKETQTDNSLHSSSRSATAPVSPASSLVDLSNYQTEKEEEEVMMRREDLEDPCCLGMEERMELEHCMKRAMAAMERDLLRKNEQQKTHCHSRITQVVLHHEEDEEEEEEEEEMIRTPPSPACSSTSGCESDCSSSGGSCRWSGPVDHPTSSERSKVRSTGTDPYSLDQDNRPRDRLEKHTVISRELPTLMKTTVIYPSITKTEVKEMPTLISRHSEYTDEESILESDLNLPEAPRDFCILRRVGSDSLLLGWTPPTSNINSYQILVDGDVQQRVRSPDRTKALLHKLDLTRPLTIAICSLAFGSQPELEFISQPTLLRYEPFECHK